MAKVARFGLGALLIMTLALTATVTFAKSAADMSGTWDMDVRTSMGNGFPRFELKQNGNKLSGTYHGAMGSASVTGEVDGDNFTIRFNSQGINVTYKGKVTGEKIKGTVDLTPFGNGSFKGKRR